MTNQRYYGLLAALARHQGHVSDSTLRMSYSQIAIAATEIAAILEARGFAFDDCFSFACGNDVASAIVLTALLASGRNFILLPGPAATIGMTSKVDLKVTFCRYHLHVCDRQEVAGIAVSLIPGTSIAISENPLWRANLPDRHACFFVPTSGSMASAKLVQHRQEKLLTASWRCGQRLGLASDDRVTVPVPIAHMFGLGAAFIPAVLAGASIDIQANSNALRYLAQERRFHPTVAFLTPSFGETIVRLRKTPRAYRLTVMAGDRLTADLFDRYERVHGRVVNLYGSTELGVIAAGDPEDPVALRRDVVGRLMPGAVMWRDSHEPVGSAAVSMDRQTVPSIACELWISHETGFDCYVDLNGQAMWESDGSFSSCHRFRSSDVASLVDGYLTVFGRNGDLVKRDGLLVACGDIAAAIRTITGIADAVILSGALAHRGRKLVAFCVPETGPEPRFACSVNGTGNIEPLRKACLKLLPARAIPDEFLLLPDLPRLPSGKVDRIALRNRYNLDEGESHAGGG